VSAPSAAEARVIELENELAEARRLVRVLELTLRQVKARISLLDRLAITLLLSGLIRVLADVSRPIAAPRRHRRLELVRPLPADDSHEVAK